MSIHAFELLAALLTASLHGPADVGSADASAGSVHASLRPLFDALRQVETGGYAPGEEPAGDGGRSIGPYQIQRPYWFDSGVPGEYRDVRDAAYAERVIIAYWKRYCPGALAERDHQTLARVHNGGPRGHRKGATLKYWRKVERELALARTMRDLKPVAR